VLAFGCSGALYNAISVLCENGDNILVPAPGFPLALPIAENLGINLKFYNLLVSSKIALTPIIARERLGNRPRKFEILNR
jgi:aspartate/methionine/tyrosine aminotransferase